MGKITPVKNGGREPGLIFIPVSALISRLEEPIDD
jgi:hypothetical protein